MSEDEYEYEDYDEGEEDEYEDEMAGNENQVESEHSEEEQEEEKGKYDEIEGEEKLRARNESKKAELNEQLKDVINEWRKNRAIEEEELQKLKELQAKRKEVRAQQEKELAEQKREEEERVRREEAEKKAKEADEKRRRLEEAEKKRQTMVQSQRERMDGSGSYDKGKMLGELSNLRDAKKEKIKTKEQQEEDKKIALSIRVKALDLTDLGKEGLKSRAKELWENIVRLETEKYDLEERKGRQGYDPKIQTASKFERRGDNRSYDDKKRLFDGGWEILGSELLEKDWKEKMSDWNKHQKTKLPKWCGERPGKKSTDPASPEEEEDIKTAVGDQSEEIEQVEFEVEDGSDEDEEEGEDEYEYE